MSEYKMTTFLQYLNEANAAGAKFEQKVANKINLWLKKNHIDNKFSAKRYQTIEEDEGSRDEDYSDVVIENIQNGEQFFVECKQSPNDNSVTNMFDISEDYKLIPVKNKDREEDDSEILVQLANDLQSTEDFQRFVSFLQEPFDLLQKSPSQFYFDREQINDNELQKLIDSYNNLVDNGETESDNKKFDGKLIRETTRNILAVALMWRLYDTSNTWDICHLDDIQYFGDLIRKHYMEDKAVPAKYMQLGDNLYILDKIDNPLNLECQEFPREVLGNFDLKFTPRFGTGSMYLTPRSKLTSELPESSSFIDKKRWPTLIN